MENVAELQETYQFRLPEATRDIQPPNRFFFLVSSNSAAGYHSISRSLTPRKLSKLPHFPCSINLGPRFIWSLGSPVVPPTFYFNPMFNVAPRLFRNSRSSPKEIARTCSTLNCVFKSLI